MRRIGKSVLVIDKRPTIAGNCYTEEVNGIHVHRFGPHIFHTNNHDVWQYVNQFTQFNNYRHTGKVSYKDRVFSFPINLMTLQQLWGIRTPAEARQRLSEVVVPHPHPQNIEDWCLANIGPELYETFVKHYTEKQWGRPCAALPASIIRRIPLRMTYNEDYYENATFQGIPIGGYTQMVRNMLDGVQVELGQDFSTIKHRWRELARNLVFCGPIDQFFDYEFGELEYRSLRWETKNFDQDFQGCSIMNYTDENQFTRILEHKFFDFNNQTKSVVSWEYSVDWRETKEPFYPINDEKNNAIYQKYRKLADQQPNITIGGRLGCYKYIDMDACIAMALKEANRANVGSG